MAATENDKMDAFILEQLGKGDPLKAAELSERARAAGFKHEGYRSNVRLIDRSLQRLRRAGKIQYAGAAIGWGLEQKAAGK